MSNDKIKDNSRFREKIPEEVNLKIVDHKKLLRKYFDQHIFIPPLFLIHYQTTVRIASLQILSLNVRGRDE